MDKIVFYPVSAIAASTTTTAAAAAATNATNATGGVTTATTNSKLIHAANSSNNPMAQFKRTTLIMPSFNAIGNVGQLAMDALIQTLGARLVGHLDCVHVIPMIASAAPPASASSNVNETSVQTPPLTTAMQVYLVPSSSSSSPAFTLLQLRSSVVKLKGATMCKSLLQDWIVKAMFRDLVIVGGLDASGRVDGEINGPSFKTISFPDPHPNYHDQLSANAPFTAPQPPPSNTQDLKSTMQDNVLIPPQVYAVPPGAGLTRVFIREMVAANCKLPLLVAGWYTSEGDNSMVAMSLAAELCRVLEWQDGMNAKWKIPDDWIALYGPAMHTKALYQ